MVRRLSEGLLVDVGLLALLPFSQVDIRPVRVDELISKELEFTVVGLDREEGRVVLSRRELLAKARENLKRETLKNLEEGATLIGRVKHLTDYGAFIDLGGIDGLLHISELPGEVAHPSQVLSVGDEVRVLVVRFERLTEKIQLRLVR